MPKYTDSPYNLSDKLQRLQEAKSEKLQGLSPSEDTTEADYEPAVMTSLRDLDSPGFEGVTGGKGTHGDLTGKESRDRIEPFDSYEVRPDEQWQLDSLLANPTRVKQLDKQRSRLAGERGVPLDEITYEDVFQEGGTDAFRFMVNAAADAQGNPEYSKLIRDWQIPDETSERFRTENPGMDILNIPVERADSGRFGAYGRPLTDVRTLGDENIGEAAGYVNADAPASSNGIGTTDEDIAAIIRRRRADNAGFLDRAGNAVDAFQKTMFKEVGIDLADLVGEGLNSLTGGSVGWDLGTEEEKTAFANEVTGFKPHLAEEDYKQAEIHAKNIADALYDKDKDLDLHDVYSLVKIGLTTPEMLGDSLGFISSMFIPVLGWGGKAAKAKKAIDGIKAAQKSGKITKEAAETAIRTEKANVHVLNKMQTFTQNNAGLLQMSAGNVNDQIDSYKQEHGEGPSVFKVGQMFATESLLLGLDRWADISILKSPAALKGVRDAFTILAPEGKAKVLAKVAGVAGGLAANMGREAAQEYVQEIGQEFNVKFNFDDNDNFLSAVNEAGDVLLDKDMQTVGIMGAGLGAGAAGQFAALGAAGKGASKIVGGEMPSVSNPFSRNTTPAPIQPSAEEDVPVTEDETKTAKNRYGEILNRLNTDIPKNGITADNIGLYLDDIDELNSTKHVIKDSPAEQVAKGEAVYNKVIDSLEKFIKDNPDVVLTKRIKRKTVKESLTDKETQDRIAAIPEEGRKAVQQLGAALGDGEVRDVKPAYGFVAKTFREGTYESVVEDEEALSPYLQNLEKSLTGSVSEDLQTTFNVLKKSFSADTPSSKSTSTEESSTVLGSSSDKPSTPERISDLLEESEYDNYSRSVDAERIVQTLLGSGREYDEDFTGKLLNFARKNGVKENRVNRIVKSFASVEEEAVHGVRGYVSRLSRLRGMVESSNPDKKALNREAKGIAKMDQALANSITQLESGISSAKDAAKQANRQTHTKNLLEHKTSYLKADGKPYKIYLRKDKYGKWYADIADAKQRLEPKKRYLRDIREELTDISSRAPESLTGVLPSIGSYTVPVITGKGSAIRNKDDGFIKNVKSTLEKVGLSSNINKVILGEKTSPKWDPKGDYYKANNLLVNNSEYTEDDVVLVNSLGNIKSRKNSKYSIPDLIPSKNTKKEDYTDQQKAFQAAVDAGATIVLDSDMLREKSRRVLASQLVSRNGYEALEGYNSLIFVKKTDDNVALIKKRKEELNKEKTDKETENKIKDDLISLARSLRSGINNNSGEPLTDIARKNIKKKYDALKETVTKDYFKGVEDNVEKFVARELVDRVKTEATKILNDPNPVPLSYKDKAFQAEVAEALAAEENKDIDGADALTAWKRLVEVEGATGKDREKGIESILEGLGASAKSLIHSIMGEERSFGLGKNPIYEMVYQNVKTKAIVVKTLRKEPTDKELADLVAKNDTTGTIMYKNKHIFLGVRRVSQDPNNIAGITRTTVLNSIPVDSLPFIIRDKVKEFSKSAVAALEKVMPAELLEQTDTRVNGSFADGNFNLYNSPSRTIIFNKDGKPNEEVIAAMFLAIGEMLKTDMRKAMRGYKTTADLAKLFNVQEFEVTQEMRDFAKENGMFMKTAASTLGKAVLQQLGLGQLRNDDAAAGEFEALVADMGNATLLMAEKQGIFETTSVKSNELAALYKNGEVREENTDTFFVHVKDKNVTKDKFTRKEPVELVEGLAEQFGEIEEKFPGAITRRKEPSFKAPTKEQIKKAQSEVRNDLLGLDVPSVAKDVLDLQMNTAYRFNMEGITDFLDAVDAPNSRVKELLGYIPENSDAFNNLFFNDKEIQVVNNREIEKSIDELRIFKKKIEDSGEIDPSLYFDYFYAGNNRYNIDSNTIDPMTDKLHRFFIVPKLHEMQWKVEKYPNGSTKFVATSSTGTSDQSYTIRLALAQALGKGVDKMSATDVIQFADAVLGLTTDQIKEIKDAYLFKDKSDVLSKGKYKFTDKYGVEHAIEVDHISHTLQALDFLTKFKSGKTFKSSLSMEFDSLTSGFANKAQQMPILNNMSQHLARTGVFTKEFQQELLDNSNFKGTGVAFDPKLGHSVADVLGAGDSIGFYDSYQNLASKVISVLKGKTKQKENLTGSALKSKGMSGTKVFEAIKPLLPGGEFMDEEATLTSIGGPLRNLFKEPFMIFNYSAGIKRIVTNLGINVAQDVARSIASADLSVDEKNPNLSEEDQKTLKVKQIIKDLLASSEIIDPDNEKIFIKTPERLQEAIRNNNLRSIKIKPMAVAKLDGRDLPPARNLEDMIENVVKVTYGEVVKDTFEEEFKPFIEVQDAMNDGFKAAFRIFDKKRMDALSKLRIKKPNKILTLEDHAQVLEDLWDDFPWIVGPLTGSKTKDTVRKDIIAVASSSTRAPRPVEQARVSPQTRLGKGAGKKTRTVTPIIRYLEEAVSAGSVLPFHAIDGAEMGLTLLDMNMPAFIAIHDALIGPIDQSDQMGFNYVKNMYEINSRDYVLAYALQGLADRMKKTMDAARFDAEYKNTGTNGLRAIEKGDNFPMAAKRIVGNLEKQIKIIKDAREKYYGKNGLMKGAFIGNLVGTGGAVYSDGMLAPDLSYVDVFVDYYDTNTDVPGPSNTPSNNKPKSTDEQLEMFKSESTQLELQLGDSTNKVSKACKGNN